MREYSKYALIHKIEPIEDYDEMKYWDERLVHTEITKMRPYMCQQKKQFHEFKLIEVGGEREMRTHMTFIHPVFEMPQKIFISRDRKWMIERLGY